MKRAVFASLVLLGCHASGSPVTVAAAPPEQPVPEPAVALREAPPTFAWRDPRKSTAHPRARAIVVTELQGLERLLAGSPKTVPDRPLLVRRLAEDYAELARSAERDPSPLAARTLSVAHANSIKYYAELEGIESYPLQDEVLYFEALEREALGDGPGARRAYYALIQRAPDSKYVPQAYFAFGELYFAQGQEEAALRAYGEVVKHPGSAVTPDAWRRISRLYARMGDAERARDAEDHAQVP
jgi:TolA-binding protein